MKKWFSMAALGVLCLIAGAVLIASAISVEIGQVLGIACRHWESMRARGW